MNYETVIKKIIINPRFYCNVFPFRDLLKKIIKCPGTAAGAENLAQTSLRMQ